MSSSLDPYSSTVPQEAAVLGDVTRNINAEVENFNMKTVCEQFGIEEYKSDAELEKEIKYVLNNLLKYVELGDPYDIKSKGVDNIFEKIQSNMASMNMPKLTLNVLKKKTKLTNYDFDFINRIISNPREFEESIKYLTKEFYNIPRFMLVLMLRAEVNCPEELLANLISYQSECQNRAITSTLISFTPKAVLLSAILLKILEQICGEYLDAHAYSAILLAFSVLATTRFVRIWTDKFENFE